jgi:hypothetical protein
MQISRRFFVVINFLLINASFSKTDNKVAVKKLPAEVYKERKLAKIDMDIQGQLCDLGVLGAIESSLLRLARENLAQLTVRWKQGVFYEVDPSSSNLKVKKPNGDLVEVVSENDFISIALKEEAGFIEKITSKKLSSNLARLFKNKKTFEFNGSVNELGKRVDVYKWNIEQDGLIYSYGLVAPVLDNRDLGNFYRPIIPHCSEEKIKDFKQKFKPLKFLWSIAGVPSAEQGSVVFNLLRAELPLKLEK